jgi:tetratricopeptide (TPR) repeat protein
MKAFKFTLLTLLMICPFAGNAQFKLYEKGHDSYKAGKYEEAIVSLSQYLTKGTRDKAIDVEVFYIRALSYYKSDKFDKAIPDFEETILRNHPNKGNIYWFLAKCHVGLGRKEEAIEYYNGALRELNPTGETKAKLLYERSLLYSGIGQLWLAYEDVNTARSLHPGNADIAKEAVKLEKEPVVAAKLTPTAPTTLVASNDKKEKPNSGNKKKASENTVSKKDTDVVSVPVTTAANNSPATNLPAAAASSPVSTPVTNASTPVPTVAATPTLADQYKDEKRFALVIGNAKYTQKIGELRNPVNDATDIADELKASNFDVQLLTNATYGQIRAALLKFKDKIDGGEKDKTVALFYYAGHGLAFEDENYLVPVDAEVEYQDDIPRYCFPIQRMVLSNMERSNSRMNIVILDACRNNPFPAATRSVGQQGLGEMKRARGSFIAYATSPGSVANDGVGRNGLYTQELLKSLRKPGLTIEQVFKDVRLNVLKLSNDKQNTWDSSNITGEFYFKF